MTVHQNHQKISYQTPKLKMIGVFVTLIGGSPIRVPIQLDPPIKGEK